MRGGLKEKEEDLMEGGPSHKRVIPWEASETAGRRHESDKTEFFCVCLPTVAKQLCACDEFEIVCDGVVIVRVTKRTAPFL